MTVDFEDAVSRGWRFARSIERLFVLFLFYLVAALLILLPIIFIYRNITLGAFELVNLLQFFVWLFVAIAISALLVLYSNLAFTHNYANQKSLGRSFGYAKKKYLRFIVAMAIVAIIQFIATFPFSMVEFITSSTLAIVLANSLNFIVSIILALVFFFVQQEIAVKGSRISKSMSNSYGIFKRDWFQVFLALLISAILGLVIFIIFAIPLIVVAFATLWPAISAGQVAQLVSAMLANLPLFALTGLILLVGIALATLLTIGIKTDIYLQLKKRKVK